MKNKSSIDNKDYLDGEQAVTNLTPEQTKGLGDTPTKDHCSINVTGYCETHDREWSDCNNHMVFLKPKSTPTALSSIDEILSQAFTDGASDTMWQNDRHVEIFATAKAKLEAYIEENYDAKN